jgi:hypothetical protein
MFGPSLKSVPGCLVSIVPMLIGLPVALTPGFGPHDDVPLLDPLPVEPVAPVEALVPVAAEAVVLEPEPVLPVLLLLLLLPQPASANNATSAASAKAIRTRGTL